MGAGARYHVALLASVAGVCSLMPLAQAGAESVLDYTCFQTAAPWSPELDIGSDVAVVYGVNGSFADRVAGWRAQGYTVSMMTGIAWGGYGDYYMDAAGELKKEEIQTEKSGKLWMHGHSTTVGYNVPTPDYVEYIKKRIEPSINLGVRAVYLEEPEYWAVTGWSEGFKDAWQRFYGEPWQAPDSSVDAQYRASKLKYELYFNALRDVCRHIKAKAREKGIEVECHVPTHSLVNYAQWRIVSPESHLMDIDEMDGYIAQVWTGTARSNNRYRGVPKERTFETAFLEYGQMLGMVRPTGRKVWFLADPIEDNPNRSWADYKRNYECTVAASLLWPEVHLYEVMPWPSRIFRGTYPKVDLDNKTDEREGIPAEYATEILAVINALNDMKQDDVEYFTGTRGIGVLISDTLMFQRAAPHASDAHLGPFFGLAMPLVKHGIPVEPVQLENTLHPATLPRYQVLLLTYEGQKPLKPEYHEALDLWVRQGGCLIFVGDGKDPYHGVREWWNEQGKTDAKAHDSLFACLGVEDSAFEKPQPVGEGYVRVLDERPSRLQKTPEGADTVIDLVREMTTLRCQGLDTRNYLGLRRGPYRIYGVMDESIHDSPLKLQGHFIDLFDPQLPVCSDVSLPPNTRALLYDLDWARANRPAAHVAACAGRLSDESFDGGVLCFTVRGPKATTGRARLLLPTGPKTITTNPEIPVRQHWDETSGTLALEFDHLAHTIAFEVHL